MIELYLIEFVLLLLFFNLSWVDSSLLFGFKAKNGVFLSSSKGFSPRGLNMVEDYSWIRHIGKHSIIGFLGDSCDCDEVVDLLENENTFYELSYDRSMSPNEVASFLRHLIVSRLRSRPFQANLLVGGIDPITQEPILFWFDELGAMKEVDYSAHGNELAAMISALDRQDHIARQQNQLGLGGLDTVCALDACKNCWETVTTRSVRQLSSYQIEALTSSGPISFNSQTKANSPSNSI